APEGGQPGTLGPVPVVARRHLGGRPGLALVVGARRYVVEVWILRRMEDKRTAYRPIKHEEPGPVPEPRDVRMRAVGEGGTIDDIVLRELDRSWSLGPRRAS